MTQYKTTGMAHIATAASAIPPLQANPNHQPAHIPRVSWHTGICLCPSLSHILKPALQSSTNSSDGGSHRHILRRALSDGVTPPSTSSGFMISLLVNTVILVVSGWGHFEWPCDGIYIGRTSYNSIGINTTTPGYPAERLRRFFRSQLDETCHSVKQ